MSKFHCYNSKIVFCSFTVWKFHDFSITLILREINLWNSRNAKTAILSHLQALNFDFYNFCTFWRLIFTQSTKFAAPKMAKMAVFTLLESEKLISHKIWVIEKSWNFHTVSFEHVKMRLWPILIRQKVHFVKFWIGTLCILLAISCGFKPLTLA